MTPRRVPVSNLALLAALASLLAPSVLTAAPPPDTINFETRVLATPVQNNGNQWNPITFTRVFRLPPVVVMGPATQNNTEQCVLRVRNVTTTGFEYQIDEWDYRNGGHPSETVHFLAFSEGVHQIGSQRWQAARVGSVNRTLQSVNLSGFSAAPVVLAQVESTVNQEGSGGTKGVKALNTRLSNVTSASFQVGLETQELDTGAIANESIGWIAVSQGEGWLDGAAVSAVRTGALVGNVFTAVDFPFSRSNPVLIAQTQTINQVDPGELKMRNLSETGVELRFQEETSADTESSHPAEEIGYLVFGEVAGEALAKLEMDDELITQSDAGAWTQITFSQSYTTPVVITGPLSYTNGTALSVRVRNVNSSGFQVQVDRWDHFATQAHNVQEKLTYIVMEAGTYAIGGQLWQAGRRSVTSASGVTQTLATPYDQAPAVFSQAGTRNDARALQSRVSAVTASNFRIELQKSEIDTSPHVSETVHWIAIPYGASNLFSIARRFQVGQGTNHDSGWRTRAFSRMHADPFLFAAMQTKNDTDPATVRWRYLFADRADLIVQEDNHPLQPGEGSVNNTHSAETVAFLTIQGAEDSDGDGAPDDWELAMGLNPNSAADGSLDLDGDLLTNQQEYHNRLNFVTSTDPQQFTGGVITASVSVSNGFEVDDITADPRTSTPARVRVNRNGGFAPLTVNFTLGGTPFSNTTRSPAGSEDYTAWTHATAGTQVTSSINLNANAQSVDIHIRPVDDGIDEYVEGVRMTVTTNGSFYTMGGTKTADVNLNDARDIPVNEKLFVGTFLPQASSVTGASGFATVILNGPNNKARISTTFNGLTTPQTEIDGSHVHYSNGAIVYGDPDGLPNGQLTDYPWTITDVPGFKGGQIVDALFRKVAGQSLYINVHTDRYSSGEIRADLARATGSVDFVEPPAVPELEDLTDLNDVWRDCARFLTQATFGASEAEVQALYNSISTANGGKGKAVNRINAFSSWINTQWGRDQSKLYDYQYAADQQEWEIWGTQPLLDADGNNVGNPPGSAADWTRWSSTVGNPPIPPGRNKESFDPDHNNRRRAWWLLANRAHDQLRQRTAFALEQIFVVSDRETAIRNRAYGHSRYYDMLADFADGVRHLQPPLNAVDPSVTYTARSSTSTTITVKELLMDISKSAIMAKYLSHLRNRRAEGDLSPDENYAREIMQLFSIGLLHLHPDGTLKLAANGQPIATYGNDDIKELARVFTGWSLAWKENSAANNYVPPLPEPNFYSSDQREYFHPGWENPLKNFAADHHDLDAKVLFAGTAQETPLRAKTSTEDPEVYANGDLNRAVTALYNHPNIAPFISRLLIQRLVTSNPSRGYVHRVAKIFEDHNGPTDGGVRGRIRETVRAILLDYEARTLTNVDPQSYLVGGQPATSVNVSFGKVKEPIVRYLQVLRAFAGRSQLAVADISAYGYPATQLDNFPAGATRYRYGDTVADLGQTPNNMPSVFNWYLPSYSPGGNISRAGLVAPELQILTENLVVRSVNYVRTIDYGSIIDPAATLPTGQGGTNLLGADPILDNIFTDLGALTADYQSHRTTSGSNATSAEWLVDRLDRVLCAGSLKAKYGAATSPNNPRSVIINQVAQISPTSTSPPPLSNCGARVRTALYLLTVAPEFIVQK